MRVLFIGGTGNISSACTDLALSRGLEVLHLNRGNRPGRAWKDVTTLHADARDREAVRRALAGLRFDSIVQFLAFRPEHIADDVEIFSGMTDQYVFISSASAYQKPSRSPVITEATPLSNPFWEYSRLKIDCEETLKSLSSSGYFPYTIVRPSHTYDDGWIPSCFGSAGYGMAWRMEQGLETITPGDGQSIWTLTHASDFAVGLVGLLGNSAALGQAFHITSEERLTWDGIYGTIAEAMGTQPKIVHIPSDFIAAVLPERGASLLGDKAVSVLFDNSKIRRFVPGFAPKVSFADGIRRSLAWFQAHPEAKVPNDAVNAEIDLILDSWKKAEALRHKG